MESFVFFFALKMMVNVSNRLDVSTVDLTLLDGSISGEIFVVEERKCEDTFILIVKSFLALFGYLVGILLIVISILTVVDFFFFFKIEQFFSETFIVGKAA